MLQPDDHAQSQDIAYWSLVGSPVVDFAARSTMGEVRLSAFAGRWVLLFCHPVDFNPVCTSEFVALAPEPDKFAEMDVQLLGLSVDSVYSHMGWIEWIETKFNPSVNFPVIEDVSMDIARPDRHLSDSQSCAGWLVSGKRFYAIGCGLDVGRHQGLASAGDAPDR